MRCIVDESTGTALASWPRSEGHDAVSIRDVLSRLPNEQAVGRAARTDRTAVANETGAPRGDGPGAARVGGPLSPPCHPEPAKDLTVGACGGCEILRLRSQARSAQDDKRRPQARSAQDDKRRPQ